MWILNLETPFKTFLQTGHLRKEFSPWAGSGTLVEMVPGVSNWKFLEVVRFTTMVETSRESFFSLALERVPEFFLASRPIVSNHSTNSSVVILLEYSSLKFFIASYFNFSFLGVLKREGLRRINSTSFWTSFTSSHKTLKKLPMLGWFLVVNVVW